jgi:hypothetical protein
MGDVRIPFARSENEVRLRALDIITAKQVCDWRYMSLCVLSCFVPLCEAREGMCEWNSHAQRTKCACAHWMGA